MKNLKNSRAAQDFLFRKWAVFLTIIMVGFTVTASGHAQAVAHHPRLLSIQISKSNHTLTIPEFQLNEDTETDSFSDWNLPQLQTSSYASRLNEAESSSNFPAALNAYGGGQIVFTSYRDGNNEVYIMDADGSNQVNLSHAPGSADAQPVLSSTGKIAFISDRDGNLEIYTMDKDGGNQIRLTNTVGDEGWMDWSPDGNKLVFIYNEGITWRLETINVNGTGRTVLLENSLDEDIYDATWSPDGNTIAFFWADSANPGVYTIPAGGGSEILLPLGNAEEPAWSPDGTKLAVTLVDYINSISWIYVTDPDGSNSIRVSPGADFTIQNGKRTGGDNWPSWSPDGRRIIYASDWAGGFQMLYATLASGSSADTHFNLSASGATDYQPDWGTGGFIAPRIWGPLSAYQTGGINQQVEIHIYNSETAQDSIVVQGYDVRLNALWANWLVYQKINAVGGYDLWVHELDAGTATNISLNLTASTSNRAYVDGGNLFWREVQGTSTTVNAGFYIYEIDSESYSLLTFNPGYYNRYSRYLAQDGHYFIVTDDSRPCLIAADASYTHCASYTGLALPAGVSGNSYAALEHGSGGNDVLATYTISPTSRTEVITGTNGLPAISGESLAWISGGTLYRQSLFDDLSPIEVASNVSSFGLAPDLLVWLDGNGDWAPAQGQAVAVYFGLDKFQGDADFTEPETAADLRASPHAGGWENRWIARVTGGTICYLDGGLKDGQPPHCVKKFAGFKIYADYEIFVEPGYTADIEMRDGSYLLVRGGSYLVFKPFYPSSLETIQQSINASFDVVSIQELEDAIEKYQQTGDTTGVDLGKLSNDMTAINLAAEELKIQAETAMDLYQAAGKTPPKYLSFVSDGLDTVMGSSDRLGSFFGLVQLIENTGRFNYPFYRDKLNAAFRNYFETIARVNKQGIFYPKDPNSTDYYNRVEVLFRMMLRDGRDCFQETNWTAAFYQDGSFQISSPQCGTVTWTKEEIASLIATADTDILRREVLRPLIKDSLDWYNSVAGLFIPSEAALSFSLLSGSTKPQQVAVDAGRMRFEKLSAQKRSADLKTFSFPGSKVYVWGTAFEANIAGDGTGTAFVEEGMPVVANRNGSSPDAYGITWQDNNLPLDGWPGADPLDIPYRDNLLAPFVVEVTPNENFAISPDALEIKIRFSQAMDGVSVTTHGLLTITHTTSGDYFSGLLGNLSPTWDGITTTLTLTPPAIPDPALYQMALFLPTTVKSQTGQAVTGTPITIQFAIAAPVGAAGGTLSTSSGATLIIPPSQGADLQVETTYQISATRVYSSPENWFPATDLAYHFSPESTTFSNPITITLPVLEAREGAAIFRFSEGEWVQVGGEHDGAGQHLFAPVDALGVYAVFWPIRRGYRVFLPLVSAHNNAGVTTGPGIGNGWQCEPFAGSVSCGQQINGFSMGTTDDGWAVGDQILLHYHNGTWRRAVEADLDLFDDHIPIFYAVDMTSAEEGWAVGEVGFLAHFQGGVWHTSRPFYETYYAIDMLTADEGWIAASNGMTYHYTGTTWMEVGTPVDQNLYGIEMVTSGDSWAVGGDNFGASIILHYTGGSWQQVASPVTSPLYAIDMISADDGWAVGQSGTLLHYQSGVWSTATSPTSADLNDIRMLSADEGWMVSAEGLIYHYNAGTWTEVSGQTPNNNHDLNALEIVSEPEIWAVGELGRMFYTDEGIWQPFAGVSHNQPSPGVAYYAVDMLSTTDGWSMGGYGKILHYDGNDWAEDTSPTGFTITGLDMVSSDDGWAVCAANTSLPSLSLLLQYDGSSWQVGQDQNAVHLIDVDMVASNDGWAVGKNGIIMHYNGSAWGFAGSPTLEKLNAVEMVSSLEGWAVGDNGIILYYAAGTWSEVTSPTTENLQDISVVSPFDVWASGDNGTILHYWLGNWSKVSIPPEVSGSDIESIYMISGTQGWAAGFVHPVLLQYQSGVWSVHAREWAGAYDMDFLPNGQGWMVGMFNYGLIIHYR